MDGAFHNIAYSENTVGGPQLHSRVCTVSTGINNDKLDNLGITENID